MFSSTISSLTKFTPHSVSHSNSISAIMASSLVSPSISVQKVAFNSSESFRGSSRFLGSRHGIRSFRARNLDKSRVFMSVSVGSPAVAVDDALFKDYKPNYAFLFPGQVSLSIFRVWIVNYVAALVFPSRFLDELALGLCVWNWNRVRASQWPKQNWINQNCRITFWLSFKDCWG